MFSNKDIMEMLFPRWLRTVMLMIIGVIMGVFLFENVSTYSYLLGIIIGIIISIQHIK